MNSIRSIASQWRSISCSSSPCRLPWAETLRSLAPKDVFRWAIRRNRFLRTLISGYLENEEEEGAVDSGVRSGLDIRNESKLDFGFIPGMGGVIGLNFDDGTGFWNHAKSGFVRRTSLSICSRISLSWKNVLHFDVVAEFKGYIQHEEKEIKIHGLLRRSGQVPQLARLQNSAVISVIEWEYVILTSLFIQNCFPVWFFCREVSE